MLPSFVTHEDVYYLKWIVVGLALVVTLHFVWFLPILRELRQQTVLMRELAHAKSGVRSNGARLDVPDPRQNSGAEHPSVHRD